MLFSKADLFNWVLVGRAQATCLCTMHLNYQSYDANSHWLHIFDFSPPLFLQGPLMFQSSITSNQGFNNIMCANQFCAFSGVNFRFLLKYHNAT